MNQRLLTLAAIVLCGYGLAGCRCPSRQCVPCTAKSGLSAEVTAATTSSFDVSAVANSVQHLPSPTDEYRLLEELDCQCTAAANSMLGNMLQLERHLARVFAECETRIVRRNLQLQQQLLSHYSAEKRGIDAAEAMVAFYRLAELEAAVPQLRRLIEETSDSVRRARRLASSDLASSLDPTEVDRQLLALYDREAEVELQRIELNGQLQRELGYTLTADTFFWPQVSNVISAEPIDVGGAVAVGLASRQDLQMIRLVMRNMDEETLPVVRAFLAAVDGALGTATVADGWLHQLRCIACSDHEVPVRCRQLRLLLDDAQRAATVEIRLAAFKVQSQYQRIAVAQTTLDSWQQRLYRLKEKRGIEETSVLEISRVQNEVYRAEIDLIHQIAELRIAGMQLRRSQGLLPLECGFGPAGYANGRVCRATCD